MDNNNKDEDYYEGNDTDDNDDNVDNDDYDDNDDNDDYDDNNDNNDNNNNDNNDSDDMDYLQVHHLVLQLKTLTFLLNYSNIIFNTTAYFTKLY